METQSLACMEVWGGNQATVSAFQKAGLDIWLYSKPCGKDTSGGDVYYLSSCASGRITRMLLADVAGHGEAVAKVARSLRRLMRQYINTIRPNKLFAEVNADFAKTATESRYATSVVHSYFMPSSTLSICNAGHPPPLIRRANGKQWELLEFPQAGDHAHDMPLGIMESSRYSQLDVSMKRGDMVLCYTDGVVESLDSKGKALGIEGLRELLNGLAADEPARLIPELIAKIAEDNGGAAFDDDVTTLLYRVNGRSIPLQDNLAAPLRWFKSLMASN